MMDPGAAPPAPLRRVKAVVAYDGAEFHGFADDPRATTVAGTLRVAAERVLRVPTKLTGAGRTDAGVHAWGQVVSFDVPATADLERLQRSLNGICGPAIVVRSIEDVPDDFNARFSALSRRYRYTIVNRPLPDPFSAATAWHVPESLDLNLLRLACDPFIGQHDFSAFCRRPSQRRGATPVSLVRRVLGAEWTDLGEGVLRHEIWANAFCHNMVRAIVGTMVDVGRGRMTAGDLVGILRSGDRSRAGAVAPAHGLMLWEVQYPVL